MSERNRFPFTATQWEELKQQALIFKYMASGSPIPPHLIFTIKTSLDSSLSSSLNLHQPQHYGRNCFQMGLGRKIDPEPGRCRRTDGKKWRCSKEAYPDSKYCERHMHRGRNRSRKPVKIIQTPPKTTTTTTSSTHHSLKIPNLAIPISPSSLSNTHHHHLLLYPNSSSSRGLDLSFDQEVNTHLLLDYSPCSNPDKDYSRYGYGMREDVKNYSGSPLKQRTCGGYPFLQLQELTPTSKNQKHLFEMPLETEEREEKTQKVMHHFFDEWPQNRGSSSWLDSEDKSSNDVPVSTTHLSMLMPKSSHDFFITRNG
ncbi:growth-regulating factor 6-like isoform X2 [Actinidia eriantha]|uniref:growth-regulating factor 6-like isoform X2 n=1 Tax=Actinidia eriantha TaxID=165200 RepID=UPI0025875AD3|nr:growth-regulating factor 6-like isoform X2 [Actinidia eriantha]